MSIPPLVCNTPPPLDQCDDENDQDDYEINYGSSQEEDSINDDLGNFTSINYKPPINIIPDPIYNVETIEPKQINCKMKAKNLVLEDLDLKLDSLEVSDVKSSVTDDCISNKSDISEQSSKSDVATSCEAQDDELSAAGVKDDDLSKESTDSGFQQAIHSIEVINSEDIHFKQDNISLDPSCLDNSTDFETSIKLNTHDNESFLKSNSDEGIIDENIFNRNPSFLDIETNPDSMCLQMQEKVIDNDSLVFSVDNSLKNDAPNDMFETSNEQRGVLGDDDFSDLCSNTIPNEVLQSNDDPWAQQETTEDFSDFQATFEDSSLKENIPKTIPVSEADEDDDFGDFDDFQSVAPSTEEKFNIHSIVSEDKVENILSSTFPETITESEIIVDKNIEISLGPIWRYLKETDERQPYIINWNASLGQKDLLKALCIDSRNILITPKWSHNMPKYAANLNNVPLQPKKSTLQDSTPAEKSTKTTESWTDPFVSNSPESTQLQPSKNEDEQTPTVIADTVMPPNITKHNEIFSSTPALQPIRQISLPETHIYTPTDSEIPRSKTHYNISTPIIMNETEIKSQPLEYSDFQDFKTASGVTEEPIKKDQGPNINTGMSILQPIKTELVMPTLNWPDPGQVKETFDDFTEFVSSTPWSPSEIKSSEIKSSSKPTPVNNNLGESNVLNDAEKQNKSKIDIPLQRQEDFNTFDVFQSNNTVLNIGNAPSNSDINQNSSKNVLGSPFQPDSQILQPTSKPAKAVGQILQPLSLESYSQINWPNPGIDLQNLSKFNPIETLPSLKGDLSAPGSSKNSPAHTLKTQADDDFWGDFVSSKPAQNQSKSAEDDEWSDFMSSPSVHNGLNTISLNVHNNKGIKKNSQTNEHLEIPSLDYVMPKATPSYNDKHLNL